MTKLLKSLCIIFMIVSAVLIISGCDSTGADGTDGTDLEDNTSSAVEGEGALLLSGTTDDGSSVELLLDIDLTTISSSSRDAYTSSIIYDTSAKALTGTMLTSGEIGTIEFSVGGFYLPSGEFFVMASDTLDSTDIEVYLECTISSDGSFSDITSDSTITLTASDSTETSYTFSILTAPDTAGTVTSDIEAASDDTKASPRLVSYYYSLYSTWNVDEESNESSETQYRGNTIYSGADITISDTGFSITDGNNSETYTFDEFYEPRYRVSSSTGRRKIEQDFVAEITSSDFAPDDVGKHFVGMMSFLIAASDDVLFGFYTYATSVSDDFDWWTVSTFSEPTLYDTASAAEEAYDDGELSGGEALYSGNSVED